MHRYSNGDLTKGPPGSAGPLDPRVEQGARSLGILTTHRSAPYFCLKILCGSKVRPSSHAPVAYWVPLCRQDMLFVTWSFKRWRRGFLNRLNPLLVTSFAIMAACTRRYGDMQAGSVPRCWAYAAAQPTSLPPRHLILEEDQQQCLSCFCPELLVLWAPSLQSCHEVVFPV